jgi:hypothetical protein
MKLTKILVNPKVNKIWTIIDTILIGCFSFTVPAFSDRTGIYHVLSLVSIALVIVSLLLHLLFTKNFHFSFSIWCFIALPLELLFPLL